MSKKKRFAGKKTKLAKHALTQVLEQVQAEEPYSPRPPEPPGTLARAVQTLRQDQLPLVLPAPDLATADLELLPAPELDPFLAILEELYELRDSLRGPAVPPRHKRLETLEKSKPTAEIRAYALSLINHAVRELQNILQ